MKKLTVTTLLLAAGWAGSAPAYAGPLKIDWVGADAKWIIHVDVEGFTGSIIGSGLLEGADDFGIDLGDLDDLKDEIGLDPRTDLMSITAYGSKEIAEDAVVIAVTNAQVDQALAKLTTDDDIHSEVIKLEGFDVHLFTDGGERHYVHLRTADRADRRIVVVTDQESVMADALRVLEGRAPSQATARMPILANTPKAGSIVFVAVNEIDLLPEIQPASEVLRLCERFTIDLGEADGTLNGSANLSAGSEKKANDIAAVVQGMLALARLLANGDPDLGPLRVITDALSVTSDGKRITISIQCDSQQLLIDLKALADD